MTALTRLHRLFLDLPIKRKLRLFFIVPAGVALLLAGCGLLVFEWVTFERQVQGELATLADAIGPSFVPALLLDYRGDTQAVLSALRARPSIDSACVYTGQGLLFAAYPEEQEKAPCPGRPQTDGARVEDGYAALFHPLLDDSGERVGTFYLRSDLRHLVSRFTADLTILTLVMLAAVILGLLVATRFERMISKPILELAATAERVSDGKDLGLRVADAGRDEVGGLTRAFNRMLERVQLRDAELRSFGEELARYSRTLEVRVDERTAELAAATREAEEARDRALSANRAKSTFLANMSHELRTPLHSVIGYSTVLKRECIAFGQDAFAVDLDKIAAAGEQLLAMVDQILDLSKVEAGRMELVLASFPVGDLLREVTETVAPLAAKNRNRLLVEYQGQPATLHSDEVKVRQALCNLLSNACKFTEDGTITLLVEAHDQHGIPGVSLRVTDTGIGVEPEQIPRLFQAFTQADPTTSHRYGGTGLGLTITRHYCQMMGGDITAAANDGPGATFTIWLPQTVTERRLHMAPAPQGHS